MRVKTELRPTCVQPHPVVYGFFALLVDVRLLLDSWRRGTVPLYFATEVSLSDRHADQVRLVREEIME